MSRAHRFAAFMTNLKSAIGDSAYSIKVIHNPTVQSLFGVEAVKAMKKDKIVRVVPKTASNLKIFDLYIQCATRHKNVGIPIDEIRKRYLVDGFLVKDGTLFSFYYQMSIRQLKNALNRVDECYICMNDNYDARQWELSDCRYCSMKICFVCVIHLMINKARDYDEKIDKSDDFAIECSQCRQPYFDMSRILHVMGESKYRNMIVSVGIDRTDSMFYILNLILRFIIALNDDAKLGPYNAKDENEDWHDYLKQFPSVTELISELTQLAEERQVQLHYPVFNNADFRFMNKPQLEHTISEAKKNGTFMGIEYAENGCTLVKVAH